MRKQNESTRYRGFYSRFAGCLLVFSIVAGMGACTLPLEVDGAASIDVTMREVLTETLGELVVIGFEVRTAAGRVMDHPEIKWELSRPGVLESLGAGNFRAVEEGSVEVTAVLRRDPSVRATVSVKVDASILARACIVRADQSLTGSGQGCAQQRLTVHAFPLPALLASAERSGASQAVTPTITGGAR